MNTITDQMGRCINISQRPLTIISLVPSITELLFDLGLDSEIMAITEYCIHPQEKVKKKELIGGPKNVNIEKIKAFNPDVIFASKEENVRDEVEDLMQYYNVYVSDVKDLSDALRLIKDVGTITKRVNESQQIINKIQKQFDELKRNTVQNRNVCYLIWNNPMMTINNDTYIHDMLNWAGCENIFADSKNRYPIISGNEIWNKKPDYIFLSSEPYCFTNNHVSDFEKQFPFAKVKHVDGKKFSWYGTHLLKVPEYFKQLF